MVQEKNIIKKFSVEIETSSLSYALELKDNIDTFFREKIYPEIDVILNESNIKSNAYLTRFERIPIEINYSTNSSIEEIKHLIINDFRNKLNAIEKTTSTSIDIPQGVKHKQEENRIDAFIHYLKNGRYPWWISVEQKPQKAHVNSLINSQNFTAKLRPLLGNKNVQKRLINYYGNNQIIGLLSTVTKVTKQPKKRFILERLNDIQRLQLWSALLQEITEQNPMQFRQKMYSLITSFSKIARSKNNLETIRVKTISEMVIPLLKFCNHYNSTPLCIKETMQGKVGLQIATNKSNQEIVDIHKTLEASLDEPVVVLAATSESYVITEQVEQDSEQQKEIEEGIIVQNAGLCLLHPFLPQFFEKHGFLDESKQILAHKQAEAISVLHYTVSKQVKPAEDQLLLEKFLCGIPFEHAVLPTHTITTSQKVMCDELLSAVLTHWKALKSSNIDVLRSEFLMREGKIAINGDKEKVFVQRKTQDILLEKLPWNLSLLKLPWKNNMAFIEW